MKNIVLIGMMGSGKTTIGQLLSQRLNRLLADTDQVIQRQVGMTVSDIFATQGEDAFRALETGVAQGLSIREDMIIACGGGLPLQKPAISALKESGIIVWLNRDPGEIFDTVPLGDRPLARQGRDAFLQRAAEREGIYRHWADIEITDFTSPDVTADQVLKGVGITT